MLKPMQSKKTAPNPLYLWGLVALLLIAGIIVLVRAFSGNDNGADEVAVVYTNAASTVAAQQLTLQASSPTETQALFTPTAQATFTPFASPTLFATQGSVVNTPANTGSGAVGCYNSVYVSDVTFQDNAVVTAGQVFTKTWKLQNNGTCAWTPTFKAVFVSGNAMGGVAAPIGVTVEPGSSADISVNMTAPAPSGSVTGYWILVNDSAQQFGTSFYVLVNVGGVSTPGTVTAGTAAASAPTAPTNLDIVLTCNLGGTGGIQYEYVGTLTWTDNSTNETGFNLYVNGNKIDSVAANITSYALPAGVYYDPSNPTFAVEAENNGVKSAQNTASELCP